MLLVLYHNFIKNKLIFIEYELKVVFVLENRRRFCLLKRKKLQKKKIYHLSTKSFMTY